MKQTEEQESWVVYKMTLHGKQDPVNAICLKSEWDAMELGSPRVSYPHSRRHHGRKSSRCLARGTSGDAKKLSALSELIFG